MEELRRARVEAERERAAFLGEVESRGLPALSERLGSPLTPPLRKVRVWRVVQAVLACPAGEAKRVTVMFTLVATGRGKVEDVNLGRVTLGWVSRSEKRAELLLTVLRNLATPPDPLVVCESPRSSEDRAADF